MSDESADECIKSERMMFAYLAGIITGELREQMREVYEREHKEHANQRYSNCAICETDCIAGKLRNPTWLSKIKKEDFTTEPYRQPVKFR